MIVSTKSFVAAFQKIQFHGTEEAEFAKQLENTVQNDDGRFSSPEIFASFVGAARLGLAPVVRLFLAFNKSLLNVYNSFAETALGEASFANRVTTVDVLIAARADLNKANGRGITPLEWAVLNGHKKVVTKLLAAGADVDANHGLVLLEAASKGYEKIVSKLLAAGTDVNQCDWSGRTPISAAVANGHGGVVAKLLAFNVDVNKADREGRTPLFCAASGGRVDIIKQLIAAKADVDQGNDDDSQTPLYASILNGHERATGVLLRANADVNKVHKYGRTVLWWVAYSGRFDWVVDKLLKANANVNIADCDGITTLYRAARWGTKTVVRRLVAANAHVTPEIIANANCNFVPILVQAARKQEWQRLLGVAFTLRPLNLPILVVYTIYKAATCLLEHSVKRHRAWDTLKLIKRL